MRVNLWVNEAAVEWDVDPGEFLSATLRAHDYKSVKTGCDEGACGACTVWLDEMPVLSCQLLTAKAAGRHVTTIEGVAGEAEKLAAYMVEQGAEACGYCAPGFIMQVLALKREIPHPAYDEVKEYLNGNLCRCTGYVSRNISVQNYLRESNDGLIN
jgi:carbon-monoxide dehydrogenase small subunit